MVGFEIVMPESIQRVSQSRVFGLDIVRALAITLVLVGHGNSLFVHHFPELRNLRGGFLGVELFFVLSGFLIGQILIKIFSDRPRLDRIRTFVVRRWMRTLPNYFLFLLLNATLFSSLRPTESASWLYLVFLQNFAWDLPRFFRESWSLAIEECFYVVLPALLTLWSFVRRIETRRRILLATLTMLLGSLAARTVAVVFLGIEDEKLLRHAVVLRLDSLAFGVLAAYVKSFHPGAWRRCVAGGSLAWLPVAVLAGVVAVNFGVERAGNPWFQVLYRPLVSLAFASILPLADSLEQSANKVWKAGIESTSLWSYSLYLVHLPALQLAMRAQRSLGMQQPDGLAGSIALWLLWIAGSIGVSSLVYRFFERPVMNLRDRFA